MNSVWKAPAHPMREPGLLWRVFGELSSALSRPAATIWPAGVAVGPRPGRVVRAAPSTFGLVAARTADMPVGSSAQALAISAPRVGGQRDGVIGGDHPGDRVGGDFTDRVAGRRRPLRRPGARRAVSSWCASSVAATIKGWAIAGVVISSVEAVVPSRERSRPLDVDHDISRSAAPGSSSHGDSIPSVCDPCPGASNAITFLREHCEGRLLPPCNRL